MLSRNPARKSLTEIGKCTIYLNLSFDLLLDLDCARFLGLNQISRSVQVGRDSGSKIECQRNTNTRYLKRGFLEVTFRGAESAYYTAVAAISFARSQGWAPSLRTPRRSGIATVLRASEPEGIASLVTAYRASALNSRLEKPIRPCSYSAFWLLCNVPVI